MAKKPSDHLAGGFDTENTGGVLSGFFAEEDEFDRRALWRLGSWGVASVGAVVLAVLANQSSLGWRRDQVAAADLVQQANRLQTVARDSQNEARRLASAVDTLNSDRDRLYSRVTVLEQGLDSVTGTIAKQTSAAGVAPAGSRLADGRDRSGAGKSQHPAPPPAVATGGDNGGGSHREAARHCGAPERPSRRRRRSHHRTRDRKIRGGKPDANPPRR